MIYDLYKLICGIESIVRFTLRHVDLPCQDNSSSSTQVLLSGNSSAPSRLTSFTVGSETWSPAGPQRAAVRAISDQGLGAFSEWSPWAVCISAPSAPNAPRRDGQAVKAGRVQLTRDVVSSADAGYDDLEEM